MIKCVIFDMDGVIVDTEPVHHFAYKQHFEQLKIDVSPEIYASFTGNSTKNIYQKIKSIYSLSESVDQLVQQKRFFFNDAFEHKNDLQLLDGVLQLIQDLHQNGFQLILASSSAMQTIDRVFERFDLNQYFDYKVSGEDFEFSKPHPAIFLHAASLSNFKKNNCIVIEDSTNGVKAANAAEIFCVGYYSLHSKLQDLSTANFTINHFDELNAKLISIIND
jgi:HAD superfamily hydrolase (TIGR01509 family)